MPRQTETYLARPGQTLEQHLLGVAEKAGRFADKIGLSKAGELIGLLHDFGKYSTEFKKYIYSASGESDPDLDEEAANYKEKKGKIDHSTAGGQWVWESLRKYGSKGQGELCAQILALCIVSHHSGLIDCVSADGYAIFKERMKKPDNKTNYKECCSNADLSILEKASQLATKEIVPEMLKIIYSERLPADKQTLISAFNLGFFTRFLFSCLIDADRIDSASVDNSDYLKIQNRKADWSIAIERFEQKLSRFELKQPIDEIRWKISNNCYKKAKDKQGIYTLTVPTGGGKTLASLRYALYHAREYSLDRIFYIIPYTSIIEQNADVIRNMIEEERDAFPWILEHHSNLEPEKRTWHSELASENWESPVVLTTMVQFLEVLFGGGTKGVRRLHQLANSVLIFDEIQTLPIKCVHLFCNAINFLVKKANATVVLCTATQPLLNELKEKDKGQLDILPENELMPDVSQLFIDLKRVDIVNQYRVEKWKDDEIRDLALEELRAKNSCLLIVNTKASARNLYRLCQPEVQEEVLFHLSTNQCAAHRKALLKKIQSRLSNGLPILCISTQLIEAGVDIDFASVIRFMAGLDAIAQAAGRCNRNGNLKDKTGNFIKGTVHVVNPANENLGLLADIKEGIKQTERVFRELEGGDVLSPEKIERYFKYYFFQRAGDMDYPVSADEAKRDNNLLTLLSLNRPNVDSDDREGKTPLLRQSFMLAAKIFKAIDAPTKAVIVPYGDGKRLISELCGVAKEFNPKAYYNLLKKAQSYTVNLFPEDWQNLEKKEALREIQGEGIFFLDERYYNESFGLASEKVTKMDCLFC